jgi:hypothetical protein
MKRIAVGEIALFPRSKWIVDVFTGEGFDNWSCFRIFRGEPKLIGGSPVTADEYKEIQRLVNAR